MIKAWLKDAGFKDVDETAALVEVKATTSPYSRNETFEMTDNEWRLAQHLRALRDGSQWVAVKVNSEVAPTFGLVGFEGKLAYTVVRVYNIPNGQTFDGRQLDAIQSPLNLAVIVNPAEALEGKQQSVKIAPWSSVDEH